MKMSDCVEWTGGRTTRGYGHNGKGYIHRQTWEREHGPIPDGLEVMHLCNNPSCINIEHLRLGTHQENMAMAAQDGLLGHRNRNAAKLTLRKAVAVRHMYRCGMTQQAIADFFGVSRPCIGNIVRGNTWGIS